MAWLARQADLGIAGGGPIGLVLALALARAGVPAPLAAKDELPPDRPIALSHASVLLLGRLGVSLDATPIRAIHVSHRGGFGRTLIRAADYGLEELGRVVSYRSLAGELWRALAPDRLAPMSGWQEEAHDVLVSHEGGGQTRARLLVLADGVSEPAEARDYGQHAVVARVRTRLAHAGTAYERFTSDGPLALLPDGDAFALVWSTRPEEASALCAATEAEFLQRLQAAFGTRVGRFVEAGARRSFALSLRVSSPAGRRVLAIGNAAQTLHPVAGQGLNLGMRDAWELSELIAERPEAVADGRLARSYMRHRGLDRRGGIAVTDALVRVFSSDDARLAAARSAGLLALDLTPAARRFLARRMMFGARALP